jgi:hypothetical protein
MSVFFHIPLYLIIQCYRGDSRYARFRYARFRISAVLFQYHKEHQYPIRGHGNSCQTVLHPLSCAGSFTDSPHHFDSGDYKLRPLMVYHSKNLRAFIRFPFYAFSIHAGIRRKPNLACNESHLYDLRNWESVVKWTSEQIEGYANYWKRTNNMYPLSRQFVMPSGKPERRRTTCKNRRFHGRDS